MELMPSGSALLLDVLDRIAPTVLPRSSIIVSDEPLSGETNYRTEFVAVLSNQPQGGFITRQPTTEFAATDPQGDDRFGFFFQRGWGSDNSPQRGWDFWGSQPGPQRGSGPQPGSRRGWGSDNPDWRDRYFRREP